MSKKIKLLEEAVCKKGDLLTLEITDIGTEGEGIGRYKGYTLFVKDALPGDQVKVLVMKTKKRFGYARRMEILASSDDRVTPKCPTSRACGGCQLQHCSYEAQLRFKENKVKDCLERIGGISDDYVMESILAMDEPFHYRNKAQFPVGMDKEGKLVTGFYAGRSHQIIENTDCAIQHPCNQVIIEAVLEFMREYGISSYDEVVHKGLVRHILTRVGVQTGEVMVCLVINGTSLPHAKEFVARMLSLSLPSKEGQTKSLQIKSICLNTNQEKTNAILGKEVLVLYGKGYIEDYIGDVKFRISPLSFYQVNPEQTKKLYDTALAYADLQGGEVVWDLYCGIGTISLFLAQKAKQVYGVEIVPEAIEDARTNAELNHMDNVEFYVGAAEDVVSKKYQEGGEALKADVVTLDPPRKGCDEKLLETVVKMEPKRIVYVSCDPATLARDVKYLVAQGYELKKVRACDMFGMSHHVETVVLLSQRKADDYRDVPKKRI